MLHDRRLFVHNAVVDDLIPEATILMMMRAGLIDEEAVSAMADEYDRRAKWASHDHERELFSMTAHRLRVIALMNDPPPGKDPAIEGEAQWRRQQIRDRTAWLERQSKGGKTND